MKAIGIVFLVLAVLMIGITVFGAAREAGGGGAMALVRCVQARLSKYFTPGITWAGLGVCCLGLDTLLKRKGQAAASVDASGTAPVKAPKAGVAPGQAKRAAESEAEQVTETQPAAAPAAESHTKRAAPARPAPAAPKQAAPAITPVQPAAAAPKPAPPVKAAQPGEPNPTAPPKAAAPRPAPPVKPARPAIRPAGDNRAKRNEQDTPGQ